MLLELFNTYEEKYINIFRQYKNDANSLNELTCNFERPTQSITYKYEWEKKYYTRDLVSNSKRLYAKFAILCNSNKEADCYTDGAIYFFLNYMPYRLADYGFTSQKVIKILPNLTGQYEQILRSLDEIQYEKCLGKHISEELRFILKTLTTDFNLSEN